MVSLKNVPKDGSGWVKFLQRVPLRRVIEALGIGAGSRGDLATPSSTLVFLMY